MGVMMPQLVTLVDSWKVYCGIGVLGRSGLFVRARLV